MNDQKMIKKVLQLTYYDFSNNFNNWLSITGLQAVWFSILFFIVCYLAGDCSVNYWGWAPNIFFDWVIKLCRLYVVHANQLAFCVSALLLLGGITAFPLIVIQNALDLAFDSAMRGFSLQGPIFSYVAVTYLSNFLFFGFLQLCNSIMIFFILYMLQLNVTFEAWFLRICLLCIVFVFLYCMQLNYIGTMHLLEYKKGILQSYKELCAMTAGKMMLLIKFLAMQLLIIAVAVILLYSCFGYAINFLAMLITWPFHVLSLYIHPVIIPILCNFLYVWAYMLLYGWICLAVAHLYRQLVCPPTDIISCQSCQSCSN